MAIGTADVAVEASGVVVAARVAVLARVQVPHKTGQSTWKSRATSGLPLQSDFLSLVHLLLSTSPLQALITTAVVTVAVVVAVVAVVGVVGVVAAVVLATAEEAAVFTVGLVHTPQSIGHRARNATDTCVLLWQRVSCDAVHTNTGSGAPVHGAADAVVLAWHMPHIMGHICL